MTPLSIHERYKMLLGRMIDVMTMEWRVRVVALGSTTFRREDARRGLEASLALPLAPIAELPWFVRDHSGGDDTAWTIGFRDRLRARPLQPARDADGAEIQEG